jgi:hypothetical protein
MKVHRHHNSQMERIPITYKPIRQRTDGLYTQAQMHPTAPNQSRDETTQETKNEYKTQPTTTAQLSDKTHTQEPRPITNPPLIRQRIPQFNTTPPKCNEAWGASIKTPLQTSFRIYFQNIDGLQHYTMNSRGKPHCDFMLDKGINISRFAETYSNWHHKQLKEDIKATGISVLSNSSYRFSDNEFNPPDRSAYLPGGCIQMCTDHWTVRIIKEIKDPRRMGWWT